METFGAEFLFQGRSQKIGDNFSENHFTPNSVFNLQHVSDGEKEIKREREREREREKKRERKRASERDEERDR